MTTYKQLVYRIKNTDKKKKEYRKFKKKSLIVDDEAIKIQQSLMTEGIVHGTRGNHRPSCDQHFTERKRQVGLHDGRREVAGSWKTNLKK